MIVTAVTLAIATGLISGLTFLIFRSIVIGELGTYEFRTGAVIAIGGALADLIVGLVLARVERLPKSLSLLRSRPTLSPSVIGIGFGIGLGIGLVVGLPFGFVRGLGYALAVSFGVTFLAALTTAEKPAESDRDPLDPLGAMARRPFLLAYVRPTYRHRVGDSGLARDGDHRRPCREHAHVVRITLDHRSSTSIFCLPAHVPLNSSARRFFRGSS